MPASTEVSISVKSTDLGPDKYVRGEVYFTYFEQSRLEHLRRLNIVPKYPPPDNATNYFAIAETQARYRSPALFGDVLTVRTTTGEVGRRSFRLDFEIRREGTDDSLVTGYSVQVWLDDQRRSATIPPEARARLEDQRPNTSAAETASPESGTTYDFGRGKWPKMASQITAIAIQTIMTPRIPAIPLVMALTGMPMRSVRASPRSAPA